MVAFDEPAKKCVESAVREIEVQAPMILASLLHFIAW